jgi:hypothetical protein
MHAVRFLNPESCPVKPPVLRGALGHPLTFQSSSAIIFNQLKVSNRCPKDGDISRVEEEAKTAKTARVKSLLPAHPPQRASHIITASCPVDLILLCCDWDLSG